MTGISIPIFHLNCLARLSLSHKVLSSILGWNLISSSPASYSFLRRSCVTSFSGVYRCMWNSLPNRFFRSLIYSTHRSVRTRGSPPVIPAPVALVSRASSNNSTGFFGSLIFHSLAKATSSPNFCSLTGQYQHRCAQSPVMKSTSFRPLTHWMHPSDKFPVHHEWYCVFTTGLIMPIYGENVLFKYCVMFLTNVKFFSRTMKIIL